MAFELEDEFHYFHNGASFVWGAINVIDWNGHGKSMCGELVFVHVISIYEFSVFSAVHQRRFHVCFTHVHGLHRDFDFKGS